MDEGPLASAPLCTVAISILFGTIIFTYICLSFQSSTSDYYQPILKEALALPTSTTLDLKSFPSIFVLLHHLSIFGLILLFAYVCEYHPPFPHGEKSYNRDEFFFVTGILLFASAYTITKNDKSLEKKSFSLEENHLLEKNMDGVGLVKKTKACDDVLNRDQTEEWKGWMQFIFLLYHYFHADEVYNSIRIMITCYVWMTGFGNFSFFYLKNDYSLVRVLQMLWRLNFLVIFLCLSQGTTYLLYYICPLHTFFFSMVYITMRCFQGINYSKYLLRMKLALLAVLIFLLWDVDLGLFKMLHFPLSEKPQIGATQGSMWEWYFRSTLDHWSTFLGMVFAANYPITSLFYRKLEAQSKLVEVCSKMVMGLAISSVFIWWVVGPFRLAKLQYNQTNSYFGIIPLLTFIYFRNLTPYLRSHSIDLLHQIGKTTLETYLMQHHIWLTSDAKSLLILIPGWPYVNFLVVSIIYFGVSRRLYKLTLFLRGMFLPSDNVSFCVKSITGIVFVVGFNYGIAVFLNILHMKSLYVIGVICFVLGTLFYRFILFKTNYRDKSNFSSLLIAAFGIAIIGISWFTMAKHGAGKILPLNESCKTVVNKGKWIPVNPCIADHHGAAYRQHGIGSISGCTSTVPTYTWGWYATKSNSKCRFAHRDPKKLKKTLQNRNLVFIGDETVFCVYQAVLRSLGVKTKLHENTPMEQSQNVGSNTNIEFKYAPFTTDQLNYLKDLNSQVIPYERSAKNPDLILFGGGSHDRRHKFSENPTELLHKMKVLAGDFNYTRMTTKTPVVFMTPPVINSYALTNEMKRDHYAEENLQQLRIEQLSAGILNSASFVLDGQAITRDRVEESYDGVRYPPNVYDAAAQILANAFDWLLLPPVHEHLQPPPPQPGSMSNPFLGFMMLGFIFVSLFLFDGFMGFSYFASIFASGVKPFELYDEAFGPLLQKLNRKDHEMSLKNNENA